MQSRNGGQPGEMWRVSGLKAEDPLGDPEAPQVGLEVWASGFVFDGGYLVLKFDPGSAREIARCLVEMADHAES